MCDAAVRVNEMKDDAVLGASFLPIGRALSAINRATGGWKQWVRLGRSYSDFLGHDVKLSFRWGAGKRWVRQIKNPKLRQFNRWIRKIRIPLPGWRFKDPGHFHIWR